MAELKAILVITALVLMVILSGAALLYIAVKFMMDDEINKDSFLDFRDWKKSDND